MTDIEMEIAVQDEKFAATIKKLRSRNFRNNLPFLILSEKLPEGQGYYEFADGYIEIHQVYTVGPDINTRFVRRLKPEEAEVIRKENGLF